MECEVIKKAPRGGKRLSGAKSKRVLADQIASLGSQASRRACAAAATAACVACSCCRIAMGAAPSAQRRRVGRYTLGNVLGEGGFGTVCEAADESRQQVTAVKTIAVAAMRKHGLARQLRHEISALALVRHPHVIHLLEVVASPSHVHLVLELLPAGNLLQLVSNARHGRLTEATSAEYLWQLLSALSACHSHGVCHRDLKPENLLLDATGAIRICDFGLAALLPPPPPPPQQQQQQQHPSQQQNSLQQKPSTQHPTLPSTIPTAPSDPFASSAPPNQPPAQPPRAPPRAPPPSLPTPSPLALDPTSTPPAPPHLLYTACGTPHYTAPEVRELLAALQPCNHALI